MLSFSMPSSKLVVALLTSMVTTVIAKDCSAPRFPGTANGECVTLYTGNEAGEGSTISYKPTCAGNCYQYSSFGGLVVTGDGTYGVDCHVYSDYNCQNQILDTGNQLLEGNYDLSPKGQSMKCYYRC
jgi:hypothetical protein